MALFISADHVDQQATCIVSYPAYYHSYPAARISASIIALGSLISVSLESVVVACPGGGGGTPYNGLYGEAPPERGTFFRFQV